MAIIPMQKMRLYVHYAERFRVLERVQKLGVVEFTPVSLKAELWSAGGPRYELSHMVSRLESTIVFLERNAPKRGLLRALREGPLLERHEQDVRKIATKMNAEKVANEAGQLEDRLVSIEAARREIEEERRTLEQLRDLDVDIGKLSGSKTTKSTLVSYPGGIKDREQAALRARVCPRGICECVPLSGGLFLATYAREREVEFFSLLREENCGTSSLPEVQGTPKARLEVLAARDRELVREEAELEGKARELAHHLPELKMVEEFVLWELAKHDAVRESRSTREALIFEGWVPKRDIARLRRELARVTPYAAVEEIQAAPGERPPVEIENPAYARPFEAVTRLYGLPGPKDLDPTLFLAGFFFIFFGFALSDFGYGATLFLVSTLALTFFRMGKGTRLLLSLLALGGVSSMLLGLLFGGYLGIPEESLPALLRSIKQFDPITSPIFVLSLALAMGVLQIIVGLVLSIVREARIGRLAAGLLDKGPWLLLFISLSLFLLGRFDMIPVAGALYTYLVYASLVVIVLTQGRGERGIAKKLFKGVFSLYDSVGYFSDVLSYSRLLALGLATTAIAFAVNTIAVIVRDLVPFVGVYLMVPILIVGHLFNLAVNTLGAFIHGARLQFVEFFTKFITDSGRAFKPFRRGERYVTVKH